MDNNINREQLESAMIPDGHKLYIVFFSTVSSPVVKGTSNEISEKEIYL